MRKLSGGAIICCPQNNHLAVHVCCAASYAEGGRWSSGHKGSNSDERCSPRAKLCPKGAACHYRPLRRRAHLLLVGSAVVFFGKGACILKGQLATVW